MAYKCSLDFVDLRDESGQEVGQMQLRAVLVVLSAALHRVVDDQIHVLLQDLDVGLDLDGVAHFCG